MKREVAAPLRMGQRGLELSAGPPGDDRSGSALRRLQTCRLEARKPLDLVSSTHDLDELDWGRFKRCLIASRCVFGICPIEHVSPDECPHDCCPFGLCPPSVCPW